MALRLGAVILAAGGSRRFGPVNKLLIDWRGKPLIRHVYDVVAESCVADEVAVVVGHDSASVMAALPGVRFVFNPDWDSGISSSVAIGVQSIQADGILIILGDMPGVTPSLLASLRRSWESDPELPTIPGRVSPPLILPRRLQTSAAILNGDLGFRELLKGEPFNSVAAGDPELMDIDLSD